jgi:dTDP-4-dehydrorhamnose reductase
VKILLFGENGQLGWELRRTLLPFGELICCDYPQIDFSNLKQLRQHVRQVEPDLIVNAAAFTDVDGAEGEPELARRINADAPGVIAEEGKAIGAALLHYSTDYVFDGLMGEDYVEGDEPNPVNVYGQTKLEGEQAIQSNTDVFLILRTSWVYGARRTNFMLKVLDWARENETLRIADDQVGSPTWCRALAEATAAVVAQSILDGKRWFHGHSGVYHLAGSGAASRYDWAQQIVAGYPDRDSLAVSKIEPVSSELFETPARRPAFTALDCTKFRKTFGLALPAWDECIKLAMQTMVEC